jgi:S-DNA-T family DNA segregation ATPase FtsK/SpoIIIE
MAQKRQVQELIAEVADLVQYRMDHEHSGSSPVFLVGFGLQRFRDLRVEDEFAFTPSYEAYENLEAAEPPKQKVSLSLQFKTILQEGPEVGVYVLAWWDTYAALNRGIGRNIGDFGLRVALPMNSEESTQILDGPDATKLGQHRAFFLDEENLGQMEKFIPYAPPSRTWLAQVGAELKKREAGR